MLAQETLTLAMPLTEDEQRDLVRREEYIEENLQTLFSVGKAFADIRDRKLYRETHKTFEEYCVERWKISRPRAYQLIDASVVQENLSTIVDKSLPLPTNEAQTRALKKVPAEKQPELWTKAVQQNNGNAPTAKQVIQVIETEFEEKKPKPNELKAEYEESQLKSCEDCCYQGGGRKLIGYCQDEVVCNQFGKRPRPGKDRWPAEYCEGFRTKDDWGKTSHAPASSFLLSVNDDLTDFDIKLERCRACLYKYFFVRINGVLAVTHITEVNEHLAKVRGTAYPYNPNDTFDHGAICGIFNFELTDLGGFTTETDFERCRKNFSKKPEAEPQQVSGAWCSFCLEDLSPEKLYSGINPTTKICRKCASKAQSALLHPDDPEVIHECQQIESEIICNFQPRRGSDLDKILRAGTLRIFRVSEHEKKLKEYTRSNGDIQSLGTWKTFETFTTKKAMLQRVQDLQQDDTIIFDGAF